MGITISCFSFFLSFLFVRLFVCFIIYIFHSHFLKKNELLVFKAKRKLNWILLPQFYNLCQIQSSNICLKQRKTSYCHNFFSSIFALIDIRKMDIASLILFYFNISQPVRFHLYFHKKLSNNELLCFQDHRHGLQLCIHCASNTILNVTMIEAFFSIAEQLHTGNTNSMKYSSCLNLFLKFVIKFHALGTSHMEWNCHDSFCLSIYMHVLPSQ